MQTSSFPPRHHLCTQRHHVQERYRGPPRPHGVLVTRLPNPVPGTTLGPGGTDSLRLLSCLWMTVQWTRFVSQGCLSRTRAELLRGLGSKRRRSYPFRSALKIIRRCSMSLAATHLQPPQPSPRHRAWFVRSLLVSEQKAPQFRALQMVVATLQSTGGQWAGGVWVPLSLGQEVTVPNTIQEEERETGPPPRTEHTAGYTSRHVPCRKAILPEFRDVGGRQALRPDAEPASPHLRGQRPL